jgi:hypothetical protein
MSEELKIDETSTPEQVEAYEIQKAEEWAKANPSELPPQFKGDPAKFLESYKNLRGELTRLQQAAKGTKPDAAGTAVPPPAAASSDPVATLQVPEKVEANPAEWMEMNTELLTNGTLSPETRTKFQKRFGLPDEIIDGYVAGFRAKQTEAARTAAQAVGGEDVLKEIIDWSSKNLNDAERQVVNAGLGGPSWQTILMGLKARMDQSNPARNEPKNLPKDSLGRALPVTPVPFSNPKELSLAFRDPRYGVDPEYTALVQERVRLNGGKR